MSGWKFFYKPSADGTPLVTGAFDSSGAAIKGSNQYRLRQLANGNSSIVEHPVVADVDSIWGNLLDMASPTTLGSYGSTNCGLQFPMAGNFPTGKQFDIYLRFKAVTTLGNWGLFGAAGHQNNARCNAMSLYMDNSSSSIQAAHYNEDQVRFFSFISLHPGTLTWTINSRYDYVFRHDYTADPATIELFINGVSQGVTSASTNFLSAMAVTGGLIQWGANYTYNGCQMLLEHCGIYDGFHSDPTIFSPGGGIDAELLALKQSSLSLGGGAQSMGISGVGF